MILQRYENVQKENHMKGLTKKRIVVANSAAVTERFVTIGDPLNAGLNAYFDKVNAGGGICGREIQLVHINDNNDAECARSILQHFVKTDEVFALVCHHGSTIVSATLEDIRRCGIPVVFFATGIGDLYVKEAKTAREGRNCFPIQPIYISEGKILVARSVSDFHAFSIGVIYSCDDTGLDLLRGIRAQAEELSVPITTHSVAPDAVDVSEVARDVLEQEVDFIILAASRKPAVTIAHELAQQGSRVPVITSYANMSNTVANRLYQQVGGQFPIYAPSWLDYQGENHDWLEETACWMGDYMMNTYAHCGWLAGYVFCEGLRRLGDEPPTWQRFVEAMEEAPIRFPFGGTVDYTGGKRMGTLEMNLYQLDPDAPIGWRQIDSLRSINELLQKCPMGAHTGS